MAAGVRVTVGTSAIALSDESDVDSESLVATNRHATVSVDLGGSDVVAGAGYELKAGETIKVDLAGHEQLYARAASGTVRVDVLRLRV